MSDSLKTARPQSFSVWALDLPISHFPSELKLGEVTMMTEGRSMSDKGEEGAVYTLMALVTLASHFLPLRLNLDKGETCKRTSDVVFGAGLYWVHRDWMRWPQHPNFLCERESPLYTKVRKRGGTGRSERDERRRGV